MAHVVLELKSMVRPMHTNNKSKSIDNWLEAIFYPNNVKIHF